MELICDVTAQDHLIKGSCKFVDRSSLRFVTTLTSLLTIGIVKVEIRFWYVMWPHLTTCLKGYAIYGWKCLTVSHHLAILVVIGCVEVEMKYLIFQVTSQNHVIEGSCNFMSWNSYHPVKSGCHKYCDNIDVFTLLRDLARPHDEWVISTSR